MIFYHFTSRDAVDSILAEGLNRGEAPMSEHRVAKAVNLTTDKSPDGHGLDAGGHVVTEDEAVLYASKGFNIPAGTVFVDKRAVRITLKLPSSDPNLKSWRTWSRKHCEEGYAERLERADGGNGRKAKTWWLYFGSIPTQRLPVGGRIDLIEASMSAANTKPAGELPQAKAPDGPTKDQPVAVDDHALWRRQGLRARSGGNSLRDGWT